MPDVIIQPTGKGISPQMPTAPTKEALAMTFTAAPELLGKDADSSTVTIDKKPLEEVKPVVGGDNIVKTDDKVADVITPKEDVKSEEKKTNSVLKPPTEEGKTKVDGVKPLDKKEVVKAITPANLKDPSDTFDYAKYTPQETINLKNMSRQSREYTAKLIDENKNLSANKDGMYYQHEQGYVLNPEFQQLQSTNYYRQTEAKVWEDQLLKIRAGKPFQDIVGFDKQGNAIMSKEMQPSDRDELRISQNINDCRTAANQISAQLQQYPQQHKQRVDSDLQAINAEQHARFSWIQDPKILDYSLHVEGLGDRKIKDIKEDFRSIFPAYLRNTVGVEVASNMLVAMQIQAAELREARNGQQIAEIKKEEISRGEPSSETTPTKSTNQLTAKGVPSEFSLSGMPDR